MHYLLKLLYRLLLTQLVFFSSYVTHVHGGIIYTCNQRLQSTPPTQVSLKSYTFSSFLLDLSPCMFCKPKLKLSKMELNICQTKWFPLHRIFHKLLLVLISLPVSFIGLQAMNMCLFPSAWHSAWHLVGIYKYLWKE